MLRSWRFPASVAALLLLLGATPAAAEPAALEPELIFDLASLGMPAGAAAGKVVHARYGASFGPPPPQVTITVDATEAAESLRITTAEPTPGCTQAAAVLTCTLPVRHRDWTRNVLALRYTPTATAQPDTEVSFALSIAAPGAKGSSGLQIFTLTGPLPDFSAASYHVENVRPGSAVPVYPAFANVGNAAASGLVLTVPLAAVGTSGRRFRNCYYSESSVDARCPFPGLRMAPGDRAAVSRSTPVVIPVVRSVESLSTRHIRYSVEPLPAGTPFDPGDGVRGTGPPLALDRVATTLADAPDADYLDSGGAVYLHITENPADVVASADVVRGRPGETVPMTLRLTNRGPAVVVPNLGHQVRWDVPEWATLTVDVPDGVEITYLPEDCFDYTGNVVGANEIGSTRYRCFLEGVEQEVFPGSTATVRIWVKILTSGYRTGRVTAAGGTLDPVARNNVAVIRVNPPPTGGGGGGGGGGLPITGDRPVWLALAGFVLVTAGFLVLLVTGRPTARRGLRGAPWVPPSRS